MKQVIGGKVYNTETAEEIGSYANNLGTRDFRDLEETLYKTRKGNFFIAGEGGALTRWAKIAGDGSGPGEGIEALNKQEALAWCESHDIDADIIAKHFEVEEA